MKSKVWYAVSSTLCTVGALLTLSGCAADFATQQLHAQSYKAYLEASTKPTPVMEIKAFKGQPIKIEAESVTFYAVSGNGGGNRSGLTTFAQPKSGAQLFGETLGTVVYKAADVGASFFPWYLAGKELGDVLETAIKNAGHNTSTTGSFNTDRHDSGNFRDIGTFTDDHSNRSINYSYNPTDRHDVNHPAPIVVTPVVE